MKRCTACHSEKADAEFPRDKRAKCGLSARCSECNRAKVREWRKRNPDKRSLADARRRAANHERVREIERRSAAQPHVRLRERLYRRRPDVVERSRVRARNYRREHLEKVRKYAREFYHNSVRNDEYLAASAIYAATGIRPKTIPKALIEAKDAQLRAARIIRSLKKGSDGR